MFQRRPGVGTSSVLERARAQLRGEKPPPAASSLVRSGGGAAARASFQYDEQDSAPSEASSDQELGAYLSSLNKKTTQKKTFDLTQASSDLSDQSKSDNEEDVKTNITGDASRFLKKKPKKNEGTKESSQKNVGQGSGGIQTSSLQSRDGAASRGSALSRAAELKERIMQRQPKVQIDDSDLEMALSLSSDLDSEQDLKKFLEKPPKLSSTGKDLKKTTEESLLTKDSLEPDGPDPEAGKGSSRFLKKSKTTAASPQGQDTAGENRFLKKKPGKNEDNDILDRGGTFQFTSKMHFDSDDEDIQQYVHKLQKAQESPPASISQDLSHRSSSVSEPKSLDDFLPSDVPEEASLAESIAEDSLSAAGPTVHIMSLDDLAPAVDITPKPKPQTAKKTKLSENQRTESGTRLREQNLHTVDELLEDDDSVKSAVSKESFTEETVTESISENIGPHLNLHTVDELLGHSVSDKSDKSESSQSRPKLQGLHTVDELLMSTSEKQEQNKDADSYEDDFDTEVPTESISERMGSKHEAEVLADDTYSETFEEGSRTESSKTFSEQTVTETPSKSYTDVSRSDRSRRSKGSRKTDSEDSYSETTRSRTLTDSTVSDSRTSRTRSRTPPRKAVKASDVGVQTSVEDQLGLVHQWTAESGYAALGPQYGAGYTDPTPVATHVVNPDALEAMTSYSPSVLGLNDLLRQQLQLTQQFVTNTRRLHQFYVNSLQADHSYTTLQDTLQFIQEHRRPVLTMEEALQQVHNGTDR
uniref:DUF4614 domain-containing protein n=1 Tax=Branchiostoma floridae TaxID=7739 RepID=C3Y9W0_BRAFL|eukprot:XP_002606859.1 hypothetical protein BRAFLDRAFT_126338 [Branchiostoma floridae]